MLYSGEPINLAPLVKSGTSAVPHLEKDLERTLESTAYPLPESSRMMVKDCEAFVTGELDAALLEDIDGAARMLTPAYLSAAQACLFCLAGDAFQ